MLTAERTPRPASYASSRYWYLHELRRVRAMRRIGTTSESNAKERKVLQRELVKLRKHQGRRP
jgi:hypothetical protein